MAALSAAQSVTLKELFQACKANDFAAVRDYLQVLLEETSSDAQTPKDLVKTYVEGKTGNSLLHYACDNGNLEACKFLLMCDGMADAFLNEPNAYGHTPLFYAASSGELPLVKWLVSNGADIDPDYSDREGIVPRDGDQGIFTPLQIACFEGHESVVNFLVECNAALSGTRRNGKTPLHFASAQGHAGVVKILLQAGADAHARDTDGKTPVDFASQELRPILLNEASPNDEDHDLETADGGGDDDSNADDGFDQCSISPEAVASIRAAFGSEVARDLCSKTWKSRVSAIATVHMSLQNTSAPIKSLPKLFDASCDMIVAALQDPVSQVVSSCCTSLLKSAFTMIMTTQDFASAAFHRERPTMYKTIDLLLLRGAVSNEKDASEAVTALLFLVCKSPDITRYLCTHIQQLLSGSQSTGGSASPRQPSSGASLSTANGVASWRLHLVAVKILTTIASQYRLDVATGGLAFADAVKMSTAAIENANAGVRTAAVDLFVQCMLIQCEQSGMAGSIDEVFEQVKDWSDSLFEQHNRNLKPSIRTRINSALRSALENSKRLNLTTSEVSVTTPARKPAQSATTQAQGFAASMALSPRSNFAQKADDLPYAEPIQEQFKQEAALIQDCFGDKVARCLYSSAWAPRVEALDLLQHQIEAKTLSFEPRESLGKLLQAMQHTLLVAMQDRVNTVYEAGVSLLLEFSLAIDAAMTATTRPTEVQALFRPLIARLMHRLNDAKARLHVATEDAMLLLSRQSNSLGAAYVLEEMIACDRNTPLSSFSTAYLFNKMSVISKLLLEFGVREASDSNGTAGLLPIKDVLATALQTFEHRDQRVRQMAIQIVGDAMQRARSATMPYVDALARASRQKVIAKLVERGVLEPDLLTEEVDEFDSSSVDTARPGTAGVRPPTASGSSTKHRPALADMSLSSTNALATSSASTQGMAAPLPYGTALTAEQATANAALIECLGEQLVRCLLDRAWAQREAAIREIERVVSCTANGKQSTDTTLLSKTVETLSVLERVIELGLNDTVARVFQCSLRLCQTVAAELVPVLDTVEASARSSFLAGIVRLVLQRLGDSKQRIRADAATILYSLASLPHIGQAFLAHTLANEYQALLDTNAVAAASPLIGNELFNLLAKLVRDGFASSTAQHRPDLNEIVRLLPAALENKHVDVRNAAIEAFAAIHEAVSTTPNAQDVDLTSFQANLKPIVREALAGRVAHFSFQLQGGNTGGAQPPEEPQCKSGRQQPLALDINQLKHFCSQEIVDLLTSSLAEDCCLGLEKLMRAMLENPSDPKMTGAWEMGCLLTKQLVLDGTPAVCLAALELLGVLVDPPIAGVATFRIPWGEWGVHLILGSTVRSLVQQSGNSNIRVRHRVKSLLQRIASKHRAGKNAVCNAILSAPEQLGGGAALDDEPSKRLRRIAMCKLRWQLLLRLELVQDFLLESLAASVSVISAATTTTSGSDRAELRRRPSANTGSGSASASTPCERGASAAHDELSVDNVVPFLGSCIVHPSPSVRDMARQIMSSLHTARSSELTAFLQMHCSPALQHRLQPLLQDADPDVVESAHADHLTEGESTVLRGSRASHVRRIAALRTGGNAAADDTDGLTSAAAAPSEHNAKAPALSSARGDTDDDAQAALPIWLEAAPKKPTASDASSRGPMLPGVDALELGAGKIAMGGGLNLIKQRRQSSRRSSSNNAEDAARAAIAL